MHYSTYQIVKKIFLVFVLLLAFGEFAKAQGQTVQILDESGDVGTSITACTGNELSLTAVCSTGTAEWSESGTDDVLSIGEVIDGITSYTVSCILSNVTISSVVVTIEGLDCEPPVFIDPPIVEGSDGEVEPNVFSLCAGSSLTLSASCGVGPIPFARWENGNDVLELTVLPGINTYDVYCDDEQNQSEIVSVTVIGGCLATCDLPPSASNLQVSGTLRAENCSVKITGLGTGKHFEFTGPGDYVFSNIYRNCQVNTAIRAENITLPGVYTLKVDGGGEPVTYTIEVGGTACPK